MPIGGLGAAAAAQEAPRGTVGSQVQGLGRSGGGGGGGMATFGGMSLNDEIRARNAARKGQAGEGGGGSSGGRYTLSQLKDNPNQVQAGDKFQVDTGSGMPEQWMAFKPEDMMNWDERTLRNWGAQNFGMGQAKFEQNKPLVDAYRKALEQYI